MILNNLANNLRKHGLTVVEIDGWQNRAYNGEDLTDVRGVLWHHTVSNRSSFANSDVPSLNTCLNGNAYTPGPLCQIMLGRSGTVYILAAGLCNHAGWGVAHDIPLDQGNRYMIGVEMESSGVAPWDWTADQIRVAPHLGAALEIEYLMNRPPEKRIQIGHQEYCAARVPNLGGKIDPAGWPGGMDGLRASINSIIDGSNSSPSEAAPDNSNRPSESKKYFVTAKTGWIRTLPMKSAPPISAFPEGLVDGAPLSIIGYVAGEDADGNGNDAWLATGSNGVVTGYIWANGAGNDISGLPMLNSPIKVNPPAPKPSTGGRKTYSNDELHWVVGKGDTISKIAKYYGIPNKVQEIINHNGVDPNKLQVGDKIWIPGNLVWIIEAPDTIRSIAAYYGLDAGYLARLNGLPSADSEIYIGNTLLIKN